MSMIKTITHKCDLCGKICNPLRRISHVVDWGYMNENPLYMEFIISMDRKYEDVCKECVLENLKKVVKDMERESK